MQNTSKVYNSQIFWFDWLRILSYLYAQFILIHTQFQLVLLHKNDLYPVKNISNPQSKGRRVS